MDRDCFAFKCMVCYCILMLNMQGLHALFTGEDDTWEAWLNVDASGFANFVSLTGHGIKLRRGYSPSNSPKPTQVSNFFPLVVVL